MRTSIIVLGSSFVFMLSSTALAQVEGTTTDDGAPAAAPAPSSAPSTPQAPAAPQAKNARAPADVTAQPGDGATPDQPAATEPAASGELDHRLELAARLGTLFPGSFAPKNWLWVETNAAPMFSLDPNWVVHKYVTIGAYFNLAVFSGVRGPTNSYKSDTNGVIASGGFAAKARFEIGDKVILRPGINLGRNAVSYSGKTGGSDFEASGGGFNVGFVADGAWRLSKTVGVSSQFGFLTQLGGSADVKGPPTAETGGKKERDFDFAPIFFLTVGPELFL